MLVLRGDRTDPVAVLVCGQGPVADGVERSALDEGDAVGLCDRIGRGCEGKGGGRASGRGSPEVEGRGTTDRVRLSTRVRLGRRRRRRCHAARLGALYRRRAAATSRTRRLSGSESAASAAERRRTCAQLTGQACSRRPRTAQRVLLSRVLCRLPSTGTAARLWCVREKFSRRVKTSAGKREREKKTHTLNLDRFPGSLALPLSLCARTRSE